MQKIVFIDLQENAESNLFADFPTPFVPLLYFTSAGLENYTNSTDFVDVALFNLHRVAAAGLLPAVPVDSSLFVKPNQPFVKNTISAVRCLALIDTV
jgi:hypothetical protein